VVGLCGKVFKRNDCKGIQSDLRWWCWWCCMEGPEQYSDRGCDWRIGYLRTHSFIISQSHSVQVCVKSAVSGA